MKRASAVIVLIATAVFLTCMFTPPASADRNNKNGRKNNRAANQKKKAESVAELRAEELLRFGSAQDPSSKPDKLAARGTQTVEELDAEEEQDPDLPRGVSMVDKEAFLAKRSAFVARLRGVEPGRPFDPTARGRAIEQMARRQTELRKASRTSLQADALQAAWVELGPNPIPNGQTSPSNAVSGRVTAIEIHPTNPNLIYVGTAQGGIFRSSDGGTNWTAIFDAAQSLAIGALALAPSNPTILYVGTGESNGSSDSYDGVGLYRIDNADSSATLVGPINPIRNYTDQLGNPQAIPAFNGRSISKILVVPNDPSTLFVGAAGGVTGIGGDSPLGNSIPPLAMRGLYKLTSATAASPASVTVTRLNVSTANGCFDTPCTGNRNVNDMVLDPTDATSNTIILWQNGTPTAGDGGIFRTTNALAATPTFTQTFQTTAPTPTSTIRAVLAIYQPAAGPAVVYEASGEDATGTSCASATQRGALRKSIDGGVNWSPKLTGGGGFCGTQCFYNLGLALVPGATPAIDKILLGGNVSTSTCQRMQATSTDGGTTFTNFAAGVHADTHVIRIAPSNSSIVYRGDDGGIFKSIDGGNTWTSLNNSGFRATQFVSIALHPSDRSFSIGGTQDNGTNLLTTGPNWNRIDGGDGGFALLDQNATDTTNVVMYHTYFNSNSSPAQIGYAEANSVGAGWTFSGCNNGTPANGINCTDNVNFYAPMAQGPGNPNTIYFGSDRLYRSIDKGTNNTVASQAPLLAGVPISSIAISPQDDNYRIVGLNNGALFFTTTGSSTLTVLDATGAGGTIPDRYVARVFFDPTNKNTAYVALGGYFGSTTAASSHLWRVTNLGTTPAFAAINGSGGTGLPDVPINALVVDPQNTNHLYAGTDIGVFFSADGGSTWNPFGTGLPQVAVFGIAIQNPNRVLRIATHGRGMWEIATAQTTTALQFSASNYNVGEGAGSVTVTVTRSGDTTGASTVDFATSDGTATQNRKYEVTTGTLTFAAGETSKTFTVLIVDEGYVEGDQTINLTLSNASGGSLAAPSTATITIQDNDTANSISPAPKRFFAALNGAQETPPNNSLGKGSGVVLLNQAETSGLAGLIFSNLSSAQTVQHIHQGAPGVAGPIVFTLQNGSPSSTVINPTAQQVADLKAGSDYMNVHTTNFGNGEIRGQLLWNPTLEENFLVRQQYLDFLAREPDAAGFNFWTGTISGCNADPQCFHDRTISTSDAFFFEPEFQQTAGFVFRAYRAAYGNTQPFPNPDSANPTESNKLVNYSVFVADRARVVGGANLAASQLAFANLFVTRSEFTARYAAGLSGPQFVDAILARIQADDGVDLTGQRQALIDQYNNAGGGNAGRAQVVYRLADDNPQNPINNQAFINAEYNRQFALTLYFGYLRRNPDINGFLFWQSQINLAPVRDVPKQNALVCSFITAAEYQLRFGPNAPRTNAECPQ